MRVFLNSELVTNDGSHCSRNNLWVTRGDGSQGEQDMVSIFILFIIF